MIWGQLRLLVLFLWFIMGAYQIHIGFLFGSLAVLIVSIIMWFKQ